MGRYQSRNVCQWRLVIPGMGLVDVMVVVGMLTDTLFTLFLWSRWRLTGGHSGQGEV